MKRALFALALSLVSMTAFGSEVLRSDRHLVKIDAQPAGSSRTFDFAIYDAESHQVIGRVSAMTRGDGSGQNQTFANGRDFKVVVESHGESYLVTFTATENGELVDSMRGGFTTAPKARPAPATTLRAGRDVEEPAVLHRVEAVSPDAARAAGAVGTVIVAVTIDRSGFVREATVVKPMGNGLDEAALDAVKQWRFATSTKDRTPVEVTQEISIDFKP